MSSDRNQSLSTDVVIYTIDGGKKTKHKSDRSHRTENIEYPAEKPSEYIYENTSYVGSANNNYGPDILVNPPTRVIREQYWVCSQWPCASRLLAVAAGVLLGAVVGLAVTAAIFGRDPDIAGFFRNNSPG